MLPHFSSSLTLQSLKHAFSIRGVKITKRCGLARALSKQGYCSRSQAAELIRAGRVGLNGRTVRDPESAVSTRDRIEIDGARLGKARPICLMMNKPRGVVTSASDKKGRKTVYDLLEPDSAWVGAVGRLDKASEGLLLLTNDSAWAARITDPATHLDKKYHVQVDCIADDDLLGQIARERGVRAASERATDRNLRAKKATLLRQGDKNSWLELTLDEGKNRQIRRLFESMHVEVLRLVRVSIGPLELGDLKKGSVRHLTVEEKKAIDNALRRNSS